MSYSRPIQVFTDIQTHSNAKPTSNPSNKDTENNIRQALSLSAMDRQINVTGVGDLVLPPDRFSTTFKCRASKENFSDAKNSVMRRVDYISQTLKNNSLKDSDFRIYQHCSHADSMVHLDFEVEAHFTDMMKCQSVCTLLAEKLGPGVNISLPRCYHAQGSLDKLRKQAGMLAIHNARQKAGEMARMVHLSVGPALQVQELETTETQGSGERDADDLDLNPSIQQRFSDTTVSISSKVSVCFQLKPAKSKKI